MKFPFARASRLSKPPVIHDPMLVITHRLEHVLFSQYSHSTARMDLSSMKPVQRLFTFSAMRARCLILCVCLTMMGCGKNVKVTGKLSRGAEPVNTLKNMRVELALYPQLDSASPTTKTVGPDVYPANITNDGSFNVPGIEGDGIPPGKYRVSIAMRAGRDRSPSKDAKDRKKKAENSDKDYFNGAFGPENSPIIREIKSSTHLDIDIDKITE